MSTSLRRDLKILIFRVTGDSDTGEEVDNEGETEDEGDETTIRRFVSQTKFFSAWNAFQQIMLFQVSF